MRFQIHYNNNSLDINGVNIPEIDEDYKEKNELAILVAGLLPPMDDMTSEEFLSIGHNYINAFNDGCVVVMEEL